MWTDEHTCTLQSIKVKSNLYKWEPEFTLSVIFKEIVQNMQTEMVKGKEYTIICYFSHISFLQQKGNTDSIINE